MALIKRIGAATLGVIQSFADSGDLVITIGANTIRLDGVHTTLAAGDFIL
jgi:hypothetical protein